MISLTSPSLPGTIIESPAELLTAAPPPSTTGLVSLHSEHLHWATVGSPVQVLREEVKKKTPCYAPKKKRNLQEFPEEVIIVIFTLSVWPLFL